MPQSVAPDLWCATHQFKSMGIALSSRMTVRQLVAALSHSPERRAQERIGSTRAVRCIVAPNPAHHLFAVEALKAYPLAQLWGAPGFKKKLPDLLGLRSLPREGVPEWASELE